MGTGDGHCPKTCVFIVGRVAHPRTHTHTHVRLKWNNAHTHTLSVRPIVITHMGLRRRRSEVAQICTQQPRMPPHNCAVCVCLIKMAAAQSPWAPCQCARTRTDNITGANVQIAVRGYAIIATEMSPKCARYLVASHQPQPQPPTTDNNNRAARQRTNIGNPLPMA